MTDHSHLPPFTKALLDFAKEARDDFCTPGHHSGALFEEIPEGRTFVSSLGEGAFTADISDSSSVIGDPSAHEGVSGEAEALAASVYGSDRCFFVLGGTSASNRIAISALVSEGDLILFDRNNHKSASQAALAAVGGLPVYLASERNESGIIGGLTEETLDPARLREKAAKLSPDAGKKQRPYRLACLQLSTYDGLFLNAREILRRIGPLCDYILFDGAWAGYENFLPLLQGSAVLTFPLTKDDPGILVTQSVHKQLAGFSMTSQLHKKDSHLRGMARYLEDDVLQAAYLMHISTSPYYPLLAGLEMNAYLHQKKGRELWQKAAITATELKKSILKHCRLLRPFTAPMVRAASWEAHPTEEILSDPDFFAISPKDSWHGFSHIAENLYLTDPCKVLLTTGPLPAPLLSHWLERRHVTVEKSDFHTLLFLIEPSDRQEKCERLLSLFEECETAYEANAPMSSFAPDVTCLPGEGLKDYSLRCMDFWEKEQASRLSQTLFAEDHFPKAALTGRSAHQAFLKGARERVPLPKAKGRVSLEMILPYPPGITVLEPGEVWTDEVVSYFLFLQKYKSAFPDFSPEILGVHGNGNDAYVWVLKEA
ncbi:MAG: ornithine decarboxylase [Dialister sp.]|nr:ornithine decarboxylase [Dialister sp.]